MPKKKAKTLEVKLRSAIRLIWSRSSERRAIIKAAKGRREQDDYDGFGCPICGIWYPVQMAEVDHIEPVGALELDKLTEWVQKMFHSPQQVLCKLCHRKKTTQQRQSSRSKKI